LKISPKIKLWYHNTSRGHIIGDTDEEIKQDERGLELTIEDADTLEGGGAPVASLHRHESRGERLNKLRNEIKVSLKNILLEKNYY
jgi:hypothetical protein